MEGRKCRYCESCDGNLQSKQEETPLGIVEKSETKRQQLLDRHIRFPDLTGNLQTAAALRRVEVSVPCDQSRDQIA
jgi:hypothetical protein